MQTLFVLEFCGMFQFPWKEYGVMPAQTHAMAFGLFASLVAPFGGFFASGFKRAFNIKVLFLQPLLI